MQAADYYSTSISRRWVSARGIVIQMLSMFLAEMHAEADWRNNFVQILAGDGVLVQEYPYRCDYLGAKAKLELINEDLATLSKDEFDGLYELS